MNLKIKKNIKTQCLIFAFLFTFLSSVGYSEVMQNIKMFNYAVTGVSFQSPAELITKDIGASKGEALEFSIPDKDNPAINKLSIVFYKFWKNAPADLGDETKLKMYGKTVYMGNAQIPKDIITRNFFNKAVKGDKQKTSIPQAADLEVYAIQLPKSKRYLFLGIKYTSAIKSDELGKIISSIEKTLKEM